MTLYDVMKVFQSGYRKPHSTDPALVRVFKDVLLVNDSRNYVILALLDVTGDFDTTATTTVSVWSWVPLSWTVMGLHRAQF